MSLALWEVVRVFPKRALDSSLLKELGGPWSWSRAEVRTLRSNWARCVATWMPGKSQTLSYVILCLSFENWQPHHKFLSLKLGYRFKIFKPVFFSFYFTSILGAFTHQSQIRLCAALMGPSYQPLLEGAPRASPQKYASFRWEVLTRHSVKMSSAEKTSDSLAGWEHPPWTAAMIVPTANSPSMRKSKLPEVVCLNFHLKERRNLGDLIFSLPITFCLVIKK